MKISQVKRCAVLSRNLLGRDFVVGDLHGHRHLLEQTLGQAGFDTRRDRLISVGDLVDRGPDSLGTLTLIEEPWFHAVLGNHELMLLNHLDYYGSRIHSPRAFPRGGGSWILEASTRQHRLLKRLADKVAELPLSIHVGGDIPFNVMHGDLHPVGSRQEHLFHGDSICVHQADLLATSRGNVGTLLQGDLRTVEYGHQGVRISPSPMGTMPVTYVGHSPMLQITVHNSYVYIDQGICVRPSKRPTASTPTLLDHRRFAGWLSGVAAARAWNPGDGSSGVMPVHPAMT